MDRKEISDKEFIKLCSKRQSKLRGIIALKGLPFTSKTELAQLLGEWLACPALCIQDFLEEDWHDDADDLCPPPTFNSQHAFARLCDVAHRHLSSRGYDLNVVIKSRLESPFELNRLIQLARRMLKTSNEGRYPLLIIECRIRSEYDWQRRLSTLGCCEEKRINWYRPRSRNDMEKAWDEYYDVEAQANWDIALQNSMIDSHQHPASFSYPTIVRKLVVDPVSDLSLIVGSYNRLPDAFRNTIKYLLVENQEEFDNRNPYVVEFDELRKKLFERELREAASRPRRENPCPCGDNEICVFKYWEELDGDYMKNVCMACGERVLGTGYTCYFCIVTLHKSCAERFDHKALHELTSIFGLKARLYDNIVRSLERKHVCESCNEKGKDFSYGCVHCCFTTYLENRLVPTIIKHNCHQHFLSIQLRMFNYICKACGLPNSVSNEYSYGCRMCAKYYHVNCVFFPGEVKHEHGGHEHVMKLVFSRHGMEKEEEYWCDFCYDDMDPYNWFYSCQECPYYATELSCVALERKINDLKGFKYVGQLQDQLEAAKAESEHFKLRSKMLS